MINENLTEFYGKPVVDYTPGEALANASATAYRVRLSWEDFKNNESLSGRLTTLFADPSAGELEALVLGLWDEDGDGEAIRKGVKVLADAKDRLPHLKALFIGDVISEENEISWIAQGDLSPLWSAYPQLEELGVRGGNHLSLGQLVLPRLKKLVVQAGGLPVSVVQEVANASLPELTHLELWLGTDEYGGDASVDDVRPILNATRFPKLTYLGLRDAVIVDDIASVIGESRIVTQLRVLDLSLGTLTDKGALALASAGNLGGLEKLDIHHHFVSPEGLARLRELGVALDASDPQEPDEYGGETYYYVAVSE